ncbi:MAG: Kazal-type serine protease inhibitor family protein [Myxococcota bacterium]|nr:Kazal-type serine protease inhibitor family protein [Myxococcota bacterium]
MKTPPPAFNKLNLALFTFSLALGSWACADGLDEVEDQVEQKQTTKDEFATENPGENTAGEIEPTTTTTTGAEIEPEPEIEAAVADAPTVTLLWSEGDEDTAVELHIDALLTDTDGSETLTVKVCGFPMNSSASYDGFCRSGYGDDGRPTGNNSYFNSCALPFKMGGIQDHYKSMRDSCIIIDSETLSELDKPESLCDACPAIDHAYDPVCGEENTTYRNECEAANCGGETIENLYRGTCAKSLSITPPLNWNGESLLQVTATSEETSNGATALRKVTAKLLVRSVNDCPRVLGLAGSEPTQVPKNGSRGLSAMINDADQNGHYTVTVESEYGAVTLQSVSGVTWHEGMGRNAPIKRFDCPLSRCNQVFSPLIYRAPTDYVGTDSVTVTVVDNGEPRPNATPYSDTETVDIIVLD